MCVGLERHCGTPQRAEGRSDDPPATHTRIRGVRPRREHAHPATVHMTQDLAKSATALQVRRPSAICSARTMPLHAETAAPLRYIPAGSPIPGRRVTEARVISGRRGVPIDRERFSSQRSTLGDAIAVVRVMCARRALNLLTMCLGGSAQRQACWPSVGWHDACGVTLLARRLDAMVKNQYSGANTRRPRGFPLVDATGAPWLISRGPDHTPRVLRR